MDRIAQAICSELQQRKSYLGDKRVDTIYFGGGTPSILKISDIESIINTVQGDFQVDERAEITLEANPDDLAPEKLTALRKAGINRLSIGIQSFRQEDLDFLSRTHTAEQVTKCITDAKQAGFQNLSIDLIYGIPTLTDEGWEQNLDHAFAFGIQHISAYSLTVEDKTPLEVMIRKGKMKAVDENLALSHYHILTQMMARQGYEHYEISNFCMPGAYSLHNTAYWQGEHYLGAGPSAHSYNGDSRQWNVANLGKYIETVALGNVDSELEILSQVMQLNEYIMTSLRTMWGCDLLEVKRRFGNGNAEKLLSHALPFIQSEQMIYHKGKLMLTAAGRLFTDGISSSLFSDSEQDIS